MKDARGRVRVTSDAATRSLGIARTSAPTRGIALPGSRVDDVEMAYARSLMRAQLKLAVVTVAGFVTVAVLLAVVLAAIPAWNDVIVWGIPLPWVLHAFAYYPVILFFAFLYRSAAARNERRYRALQEGE